MGGDYADAWLVLRTSEGKVIGLLAAYYVCNQCAEAWNCFTLILGKQWSQKFTGPLETHQKWYCVCCGTKYKAAMGMLIDIITNGQPKYARAPFKDWDLFDCLAIKFEANSSEIPRMGLFLMLPDAKLDTNSVFGLPQLRTAGMRPQRRSSVRASTSWTRIGSAVSLCGIGIRSSTLPFSMMPDIA